MKFSLLKTLNHLKIENCLEIETKCRCRRTAVLEIGTKWRSRKAQRSGAHCGIEN